MESDRPRRGCDLTEA
uniref:Uncharacterized protein n=1 Tax=Anguilla anguilla TaxID=7936 RepID=A0A0E9RHJ0_ANGAN